MSVRAPGRRPSGAEQRATAEGIVFAGHAGVLQAVAEGRPLREVLDKLTTTIEAAAPGMRASVLLLDGRHLRHGSAPSLHIDYVAAIDGLEIGPAVGSCGTAAHEGHLVVVEDVLDDHRWADYRELAVTYGFRSCWSAPVLASDGDVLGTFALYYDDPCLPSVDEIELIEAAAQLAAIALERDRDRRELEASEERFRALFASSPVGMALVDHRHVVLEANTVLAGLLEVPAGALVGRRVQELVHQDEVAAVRAAVDGALGGEPPAPLDARLRGGSGLRWAELTVAQDPRDDGAEPRCVAVFQDTTQRRQVEQLRARQLELELAAAHADALAGLARAAVIVNSQRSVEEMLASITEQACAIIGANLGSTSLTVRGTGAAEGWPQLGISVHLSDEYAAWRDYDAPSRGAASYGLVCANNDVVRMTDEELKRHPLWAGFAQEADRHPPMRGWLAAPLVASDGSNLGMLQLSDKIDGEFTASDESIVVQLAQMASVAVEKAQLQEAAAEQRHARLREELLSGLSHDMQTPLATIVGLVDVLPDVLTPNDGTQRAVVDALARQSDHLYVLIQQFLDHLRLEARRELRLTVRPVDPHPMLRRVVALFAHLREVRVVGEQADGARVMADPVRLQQVLTNLVANAVKFSDDVVEVRLEPTDGHVVFHVEDRGVGLDDLEDPEVVFERFYRGPKASGTPGTGLGLFVTREVVRAMGGQIAAMPRPGGGACFSVTLPTEAGTR